MPSAHAPLELLRSDPSPAQISRVDAARRTIDLVFLSGSRIRRMNFMTGEIYYFEFEITPEGADLERLNNGAPVLDSHQQFSLEHVIGVVERAWLQDGKAYATVRFSERAEVEPIFEDVKNKIIRAVSAGIEVLQEEWLPADERSEGLRIRKAKRWRAHELSFVAVGSDAGALTLSAHALDSQQGAADMPKEVVAGGAAAQVVADALEDLGPRARTFYDHLAAKNEIPLEQLNSIFVEGESLKQIRTRVLEYLAGTTVQIRPGSYMNNLAGYEGRTIQLMAEGLVAHYGGPKPSDEARQYANMRVRDIARECLNMRQVSHRGLSDSRMIELAMTTSDFPGLLQDTGNRELRRAYQAYQGGLRRACKQSTAQDFRAKQKLKLGESPTLLKVNEGGEFKYGAMVEYKETYSLATYGRIVPLTRQALINDDLGAFLELMAILGRGAYEFENQNLVDLVVANPTMADGFAVFQAANHKNLAGTPAAIDVTSLGLAKEAMRLQKGLNGTTPIDATPKHLVVPAKKETIAQQYLTQLQANQASNVNPFGGQLELIVEPRLDASSTTAWYLAADPATIDTVEYSYLADEPGVYLEARPGFSVDGMEFKCRLDFGAGILDFRGLYKNAGA